MAARFRSPQSGSIYTLNTTAVNRYQAQEACLAGGGHAVSYTSIVEQFEVENWFTLAGVLLPSYHKSYWLGLYIPQVNTTLWPNFQWLDGSPAPSNPSAQSSRYAQWGELTLSDGRVMMEPNNLVPPEFCVAANASQAQDSVWGWADQNCDTRNIFICKIPPSPPPMPPPPPPSPPPPAPPADLVHTSAALQAVFYFNNAKLRYNDAQSACVATGGSLVTYHAAAKQQEVEAEFRRRSALAATQGEVYWMGLRVLPYEGWPYFGWVLQDGSYQKLRNSSFQNWGTFKPGRRREPNNIFPPEMCGGANFTEMVDGLYGWVDARCDMMLASICEVPCE